MTTSPRALFDITVLMDALVQEQDPGHPSATLLTLATTGQVQGFICAAAIEPIHNELARSLGTSGARAAMQRIRSALAVAPVDSNVIDAALALGWTALDDAITVASTHGLGIDRLVTLNGGDFSTTTLSIEAPEQFLSSMRTG
ncbi:MAG: PIN domain-containing protein [Sphingobacteriia bacterium]|nr:PIN domain-containing protein [Sphingobacteriia bacterium]NCC38447.1 PIN domain-containing protein [Gammaproteobacteria bacterium]